MLLFVTNRSIGKEIPAEPFTAAGIFCYCSSYRNARKTFCEKEIGSAVLDGTSSLEKAETLCRDLHAEAPEMPIALIASPDDCPNTDADALIRVSSPEEIPTAVLQFCKEFNFFDTVLSSPYLSFEEPGSAVRLLGYPLKLSPSEYRLLSCLFYLAPRTVPVDDLSVLSFPGQAVKPSALSVLIAKINRKAKPLGADPLIKNVYGRGYRLSNAIFDLRPDQPAPE